MSKIGNSHRSNKASNKPTLASLAAEIRHLRERLEDMEDLLELRAAVERNAGKPGAPFMDDSERSGQPIPMSEIRKKYNL